MPRKLNMKWITALKCSFSEIEFKITQIQPRQEPGCVQLQSTHSLQQPEESETFSKKWISLANVLIKVCLRGAASVIYVVLLIVLFVYISKDYIARLNVIALQYRSSPNSQARIIHHLANSLHGGQLTRAAVFIPLPQSAAHYPVRAHSLKVAKLFRKEIWPPAKLQLSAKKQNQNKTQRKKHWKSGCLATYDWFKENSNVDHFTSDSASGFLASYIFRSPQ